MWHTAEKALYYRPDGSRSLEDIQCEVARGVKGPQINLLYMTPCPGQIGFTAKVRVLSEPGRFNDDPKNPTNIALAGDDFMDFLAACEKKVAQTVGDAAQLKPLEHVNIYGERYARGKLHTEMRYWDQNNQRTEEPTKFTELDALIMGQLRPWLMHGQWGLSLRIFQLQTL